MSDRVAILGLEIFAPIGVYAHEKERTQRLLIDIEVDMDLKPAGRSDRLEDAIDYDGLAAIARTVATERHHELIEAVSEEISGLVLKRFDGVVSRVLVRVQKPGAVPDARTVMVETVREPG